MLNVSNDMVSQEFILAHELSLPLEHSPNATCALLGISLTFHIDLSNDQRGWLGT